MRRPVSAAPYVASINSSAVLLIVHRRSALLSQLWSLSAGDKRGDTSGMAETWTVGVAENRTVYDRVRPGTCISGGSLRCGGGIIETRSGADDWGGDGGSGGDWSRGDGYNGDTGDGGNGA